MATDTVRSADGTTIAYERVGTAPPLVLVPGAFGERSILRRLASALAPRFTVHTYDRRGRGDSGDRRPYAVDREVEDLAAVIAAAPGIAGADDEAQTSRRRVPVLRPLPATDPARRRRLPLGASGGSGRGARST